MAKVSLLLDTDIFIDYFNTGRFHALFDSDRFTIYYSIITQKSFLQSKDCATLNGKPSFPN